MHASQVRMESVDHGRGGPRLALACALAGAMLAGQAQAQVTAGIRPPGSEGPAARLEVRGGRPHARAWLQAQGQGHLAGEWLELDGQGSYSRELRAHDLDGVQALSFMVPTSLGAGGAPVWTGTWRRHRRPAETKLPTFGAFSVSEIMKDPTFVSDSAGEYFEIVNHGNKPVDIEGWSISDLGSNFHTLDNGGAGLVVSPGEHFVLGIQDDPLLNGGFVVDYRYTGFTLSNGADEVVLSNALGQLVDQVIFDGGQQWPDLPGSAMSLDPGAMNAVKNDDPSNWCNAQTPLSAASTDLGTPGASNDLCP